MTVITQRKKEKRRLSRGGHGSYGAA
uniref:Uncharacterized protein n=1 Tax=Anguilla anguilla TaxID=7936 RepID=A0A0E9S1I3_ANGAN